MKEQYAVFRKYKRDWLSEVTGYSKGYLCRIATGKTLLTRSFIYRLCSRLNESEEELFRKISKGSNKSEPNKRRNPFIESEPTLRRKPKIGSEPYVKRNPSSASEP